MKDGSTNLSCIMLPSIECEEKRNNGFVKDGSINLFLIIGCEEEEQSFSVLCCHLLSDACVLTLLLCFRMFSVANT
jgi:hypothetical protein